GSDQGRFPAHPIAEVTEEDSPQRPGDEANGKGTESENSANERIKFGKEERGKNEGGRGTVEKKVIPLDRGADGAGGHRLEQLPPVRGGSGGRGFLLGHPNYSLSAAAGLEAVSKPSCGRPPAPQ